MEEPALKFSVLPEFTTSVAYWSNVAVPLTDSEPEPANVIPETL